MKKIICILLISIISFFCNENFEPYGEFKDSYSLTMILRSDTVLQVAALLKNYRFGETGPNIYSVDPSIKGADIRVWYNDSVYVFKDTSVLRIDTSKYNFPFSFYYNDRFRVENNKPIEVEALLSNGKRLKSSSRTPGEIHFKEISEVIIPPVNKNFVQFAWDNIEEGTFYTSYLAIKYLVSVNGSSVEKLKEIPLRFNGTNPFYPIATNQTMIVYDIDAVARALEEISSGDPNKQNYSIYKSLVFSLIAYDQPLSRYVSSTSQSLDDLTVSVNSSDYTNIEGGFGIFGSYTKKDYTRIKFIESYIRSFGYNFINED